MHTESPRYEALRPIGHGGQGTVWLGWDRERDDRVALREAADAHRLFALRADLRHPSLASARDVVERAGGPPLLVEEYVEGTLWAEAPPGEPASLLLAARHLLHALAYLHEKGLVHRDVKPHNLVLSAGGLPVLIDFGLAERCDAVDTRSGTLGTVAPEVLGPGGDPRLADLWSLGVTLLAAALHRPPDPRWSLTPDLLHGELARAPAVLQSLLKGLSSPRPGDRFDSALAALATLPAASGALPAAADWPFVGNAEPLATLVAAWSRPGATKQVACIIGPQGSGRRTLATRLVRQAQALELGAVAHVHIENEAATDWEALLALARRGRLAVTAAAPTVADRLAACLGEEHVLVVSPAPLALADVEALQRWLPQGSALEAADLLARCGGQPGALASLFGGHEAHDDRAAPCDAEVYLAVRGARVFEAEVADSRAPHRDDLLAAARLGAIVRERDGSFSLRSPERAGRIRATHDAAALRAAHALAAARLGAAHPAHALHRAAAGDTEALPQALHDLTERAAHGHAAEAAERLVELQRLAGAEALRAPAAALAELGRALVRASRLAAIEPLLAQPPLPPPLQALYAYVLSERGDLENAIAEARQALAREPRLPLACRVDLARALQFAGRHQEALLEIDGARADSRPPREHAELLRLKSLVLFRLGRIREGRETAEAALELLGPSQDGEPDALRLGTQQNLAMICRHQGDHAAAAALFETAGDGFAALGDLRNAAIVWINSGLAWQDAGDLARSQELRQRALRRATLAALAQPRDVAQAGLGIVLALRGAFPAACQVLQEARHRLALQGLEREARLARTHEAAARGQVAGRQDVEGELGELLHQALAGERHAEAAVAWQAMLDLGLSPRLPAHRAHALLATADRATRESLRTRLHARRLAPLAMDEGANQEAASAPARRGADRSARALARLARTGLPRTRLHAALSLAEHAPATTRRAWLGQALRLGRRSKSPADRIRARLAAIEASRHAWLHARLVLRDLAEVERLYPVRGHDAIVKTWNEQIAELRQHASRLAAPTADATLLGPFVAVNRALLDERLDLAQRNRVILEQAMRLVGAWRGMIVQRLRRGERVAISLVRTAGAGAPGLAEEAFSFSQSLLDEVLDGGQPKQTVNALEDPEWRFAPSVVDFKLAAIACVPVRAGDEVIGALYLDNPFDQGGFAKGALAILEAFGSQVSLCLSAAGGRDEARARSKALERELESAQQELEEVRARRSIVYESEAMANVMKQVRRLAATDLPVHVRGETGTGKELVARKLHELSPRRQAPFVSESCSAIAAEILESELFGHVQGAFTGAVRDKEGLLRAADGGTLFLDEIGDMPLALQSRLLRVLQEGEVRPVGSEKPVKVDVRLVTATHRDLAAMVRDGTFREDLYYRIVVASVELPPLRERRDDVRLLAMHFLRRFGQPGQSLAPQALQAIERHAWPGNVRELESALRSAVVMAGGETIEVEHLPAAVQRTQATPPRGGLPTTNLQELEKLALQAALEQAQGNREKAAKLLGISRSSVFVKIRELGLS